MPGMFGILTNGTWSGSRLRHLAEEGKVINEVAPPGLPSNLLKRCLKIKLM